MENGDVINGITLIEKYNGHLVYGNRPMSTWKCHCGNIFEYGHSFVQNGSKKSCGCLKYDKSKIVGSIYNYIEVLSIVELKEKRKDRNIMVLAQCHCGVEFETNYSTLKRGRIVSCGCSRMNDMVGVENKYVTVLESTNDLRANNGSVIWKCSCNFCDNIIYLSTVQIKTEMIKACECVIKSIVKKPPRVKIGRKIGPEHHWYNPNLTDKDRTRSRPKNVMFRKELLNRDGYMCKCCGKNKTNNELVAHHLNGYHWCVEQRSDINNGIIICHDCHKLYHSIYGHKYNTREQFTEFYLSHSYSYNV